MWQWLKNLWRPEQRQPFVSRSSKWPAVRDKHLRFHPYCEACGTSENTTAHHITPVHVDPARELDETNLITLCDVDHLLFGHLRNWRSWNPDVAIDAVQWRRKILNRPTV